MKKILLFLFLISLPMLAQTAGNSGLSFLKFGFGARNTAMGDAGSVSATDVTSLFYNPSALSVNTNEEIIFMHSEWIQDVRSEVLGVKFMGFGIPFGLGFNVTNVSDIEVRHNAGDPETTFDANFFTGSLSTGFIAFENVAFGATVKYIYEGYLNEEATGLGFDIGLRYTTPLKGLIASAAFKNIGSMNKLKNVETELPSEFRIGALYDFDFFESVFDLSVAAELDTYTKTDDVHFNLGTELTYKNTLALRVGYQSGWESRSFTGGVGVVWGRLNFDYAFLPFTYGLGSANLFSLKFRF